MQQRKTERGVARSRSCTLRGALTLSDEEEEDGGGDDDDDEEEELAPRDRFRAAGEASGGLVESASGLAASSMNRSPWRWLSTFHCVWDKRSSRSKSVPGGGGGRRPSTTAMALSSSWVGVRKGEG